MGRYACSQCGRKIFETVEERDEHFGKCNVPPRFVCEESRCGYSSSLQYNWRRHQQTHVAGARVATPLPRTVVTRVVGRARTEKVTTAEGDGGGLRTKEERAATPQTSKPPPRVPARRKKKLPVRRRCIRVKSSSEEEEGTILTSKRTTSVQKRDVPKLEFVSADLFTTSEELQSSTESGGVRPPGKDWRPVLDPQVSDSVHQQIDRVPESDLDDGPTRQQPLPITDDPACLGKYSDISLEGDSPVISSVAKLSVNCEKGPDEPRDLNSDNPRFVEGENRASNILGMGNQGPAKLLISPTEFNVFRCGRVVSLRQYEQRRPDGGIEVVTETTRIFYSRQPVPAELDGVRQLLNVSYYPVPAESSWDPPCLQADLELMCGLPRL